ncbi:MAG: hypothetical protein GEU83_12105 [Pseudonocardiaceae bacterium]|nr:hypothetical protein [Pseudonocardiaceae bacterium]
MNLPDLIRYVNEVEGVSYGEMVQRAADAGYNISRPAISQIVYREIKGFPYPHTLFGLAAALRRHPFEVLAAAGETFGVDFHVERGPAGEVTFSIEPPPWNIPEPDEPMRKMRGGREVGTSNGPGHTDE